jgi:hypothetical protein
VPDVSHDWEQSESTANIRIEFIGMGGGMFGERGDGVLGA